MKLKKITAGFTLIELLVVIAIIGVLAGLLTPALQASREKGRQTNCKNNLHQLSVGVIMYNDDHKDMPDWLSDLYPKYISDKGVYVCKSDRTQGTSPYSCKPEGILDLAADPAAERALYSELSDNDKNPEITACSYMYEFNGEECDWGWEAYLGEGSCSNLSASVRANASWKVVKKCQLAYGDASNGNAPYGETRFPVIRCFHHWQERTLDTWDPSDPSQPARDEDNDLVGPQALTLNVSYSGNVYEGPLTWELTK